MWESAIICEISTTFGLRGASDGRGGLQPALPREERAQKKPFLPALFGERPARSDGAVLAGVTA